jgi:hypothetical protein
MHVYIYIYIYFLLYIYIYVIHFFNMHQSPVQADAEYDDVMHAEAEAQYEALYYQAENVSPTAAGDEAWDCTSTSLVNDHVIKMHHLRFSELCSVYIHIHISPVQDSASPQDMSGDSDPITPVSSTRTSEFEAFMQTASPEVESKQSTDGVAPPEVEISISVGPTLYIYIYASRGCVTWIGDMKA